MLWWHCWVSPISDIFFLVTTIKPDYTICNRRYDVNEALQNDFRCKNDGGVLTHLESERILEDKQSRIDFLNKKLNELKQLVK